jgi:hypothetical protein
VVTAGQLCEDTTLYILCIAYKAAFIFLKQSKHFEAIRMVKEFINNKAAL